MKTTTNEARNTFIKVFKGEKNFVTPNVLCYFTSKAHMAELSTGTAMGRKLFGVAVLRKENGEWLKTCSLSKSFGSKQEALDYINKTV